MSLAARSRAAVAGARSDSVELSQSAAPHGRAARARARAGVRGALGLGALLVALLIAPSLALGASKISGKVTDTDGNPLADICVEAQAPILGGTSNRSALTGSDGRYTIDDLFTYPEYRVFFHNCGTGNFAPEYYDDAADLASADPVDASNDGAVTPNINAELEPGGSVSGTVLSGSDPLDDVCVEAFDDGEPISSDQTAADGTYRVPNLPAGEVEIGFAECSDYDGIWVGEYWLDARDLASADPVAVVAGSDSSGIDADLPVEGEITGNVSSLVGGDPLADICVDAFDQFGGLASSAKTDAGGDYRVGGLLGGDYDVRFSDCEPGGGLYLEQYYDAKTSADADPVSVSEAAATPGIDAELQRTATVAGTVSSDPDGDPVEGACVGIYDDADELVATTETDLNGDYQLGKLIPGDYRVAFLTAGLGTSSCSPVDFLTEYYDGDPLDGSDAAELAAAQPIALTPDEDRTGIDARLSHGGAITGTITDTGDPANGLDGICAEAYDDSGELVSTTETDFSGSYRIEALASGDYRVGFRDCADGEYLSEFYDDAADLASATSVGVTAGETTDSIDAVLGDAAVVTGEVTDANGDGISTICVSVEGVGGGPTATGSTGFDGIYRIGGLTAGDYTVHFDDCFGNTYRGEYYDDETDPAAAKHISLIPGFPRIADASLARGGSITGTVTDGLSSDPLEGICVRASDGTDSVIDLTGPDGNYSVDGLDDGDYTLRFSDCSGAGYLTEYYDDQSSAASAAPVAAAFDEVTPGIDAELALGGSITGTITSEEAGSPELAGICVEATGPSGTVTAVSVADGTYAVRGLLGGSYSVRFVDCGQGLYRSEDYDALPLTPELDPVMVVVGLPTSGVDAELALPGSISGRVINAVAQPLEGVCVKVYDSGDDVVSTATTDAGGVYSAGQLAGGQFRVGFSHCSSAKYFGTYEDEFYDDQLELGDADPITVIDGEDSGGIDAALSSEDGVPPQTVIDGGPSGTINYRSPDFIFSADEAGSSFECKLDGPGALEGDYGACASPGGQGYLALPDGDYLFSVVATDPVGNADPTAATRSFTVDTTAPQSSIDSGPAALDNDPGPSFAFSADEPGSSFECRLLGPGNPFGTFDPCFSPADYSGLPDGDYTFDVRATDAAGNQGEPETAGFTIDTQGPNTSVSGPSGTVTDGHASFNISGSGGASGYECRLQGPGRFEGFATCAQSKSYAGLGDGSYKFEARARDAAGNFDPSPAAWNFTVKAPTPPPDPPSPGDPGEIPDGPDDGPGDSGSGDHSAPETDLTRTPKGKIKSSKKAVKASFFFTSSEAGGFECSLDGSGFSPCSSPFKTKVKKGSHSFAVRAVDGAGNLDPSPAECDFKVVVKKSKKGKGKGKKGKKGKGKKGKKKGKRNRR